jgi:mono/diheme cytochrome c family protein
MVRGGLVFLLILTLTARPVAAGSSPDQSEPTPRQRAFFESKVRPVLVEHCLSCHGPDAQKGGLRLDSPEAALAGGDSGPAVVPGNLDESLLIEAVHQDGLRMPPKGKLPDAQVTALETWISQGAPWPSSGHATTGPTTGATRPSGTISDDDRDWWAFQPIREAVIPTLPADAWSRNPIDRFVLERLRRDHLAPAPEADRATLIRRLTFDLTGLPPTPDEVAAFRDDPAPDAYDRLVDRLLDSPRHGERQARAWLDLVRYAESDGHRQDAYRPDAFRYRDWLIDAFNADMPFDQFARAQIAGDEIAPDDPSARVATTYYRLGTYEFNQRDVKAHWDSILDDITDVTGEAFLGLSVGCAKCHDHKFDPILQADYYRLRSFFAALIPRDDLPLATASEAADHRVARAAWDLATAEIRDRLANLERPVREAGAKSAVAKFNDEFQALLARPEISLSIAEKPLHYLAFRQVLEEWKNPGAKLKGDAKKAWDQAQADLARFDRIRPPDLPAAFVMTDSGPIAPATIIPGDRKARAIEPDRLTVLASDDLAPLPPITPSSSSTGRRAALASWLTDPRHPLTARVIVNRLWQGHFGRGIVGTSSDFGRLGDPPSHPELLDWLARDLVANGWSLKVIHRAIVTSSTYRQSSRAESSSTDVAHRVDPENLLLWRYPARRLDAESIRDAALAASGELDLTSGGPSVDASKPRRSIYTKAIRNSRDELLDAFDAPDASLSTARRNVTVTPTQALHMMNGPWLLERSQALAGRLIREVPDISGAQARVDRAYQLAFGRDPDSSESAEASEFLRRSDPKTAWADLAHVLLNSSEFLTLD